MLTVYGEMGNNESVPQSDPVRAPSPSWSGDERDGNAVFPSTAPPLGGDEKTAAPKPKKKKKKKGGRSRAIEEEVEDQPAPSPPIDEENADPDNENNPVPAQERGEQELEQNGDMEEENPQLPVPAGLKSPLLARLRHEHGDAHPGPSSSVTESPNGSDVSRERRKRNKKKKNRSSLNAEEVQAAEAETAEVEAMEVEEAEAAVAQAELLENEYGDDPEALGERLPIIKSEPEVLTAEDWVEQARRSREKDSQASAPEQEETAAIDLENEPASPEELSDTGVVQASWTAVNRVSKKRRRAMRKIADEPRPNVDDPQLPAPGLTLASLDDIEQSHPDAENGNAAHESLQLDDVVDTQPNAVDEDDDQGNSQATQRSSLRRKRNGKKRVLELEDDPIADEHVDIPSSVRPSRKRNLPDSDVEGGQSKRKKKRISLPVAQVEEFEYEHDDEVVAESQEKQDHPTLVDGDPHVPEETEDQLPSMSFPDPEAESIMERIDPDSITSEAAENQQGPEEDEVNSEASGERQDEDVEMVNPPLHPNHRRVETRPARRPTLNLPSDGGDSPNKDQVDEDQVDEDQVDEDQVDEDQDVELSPDKGNQTEQNGEADSSVEDDPDEPNDDSEKHAEIEEGLLRSSPPVVNGRSSTGENVIKTQANRVTQSGNMHLSHVRNSASPVDRDDTQVTDGDPTRNSFWDIVSDAGEPGSSQAKSTTKKSSKRKPKVPYFLRPEFQNLEREDEGTATRKGRKGKTAKNVDVIASVEPAADEPVETSTNGHSAAMAPGSAAAGSLRSAAKSKRASKTKASNVSAAVASSSENNPLASRKDVDDGIEVTLPQSTEIRTGRFTDHEVAQVQKAVDLFQGANGLTRDELVNLVQSKVRSEATDLSRDLWFHVMSACPTRKKHALILWCRMHYHNYVGRGKWTEEQDDELQRMIATHGKKWSVIGKLINRNGIDVRNRWRDYLTCRDSKKPSRWSADEEQKFLDIVMDCLKAIRRLREKDTEGKFVSKSDEELIDWSLVSERMGFTRSRVQVADKWRRMRVNDAIGEELSALLPSSSHWRVEKARKELRTMTVHDKYLLVRGILNSNVIRDHMIKWGQLNDGLFGKKFQRPTLTVCWARLKQAVPDYKEKTTRECAQHLAEMYEKESSLGELDEVEIDSDVELEMVELPSSTPSPRSTPGPSEKQSASGSSPAARRSAVASSSKPKRASRLKQLTLASQDPSQENEEVEDEDQPASSKRKRKGKQKEKAGPSKKIGKETESAPPSASRKKGKDKESRPASRLSALVQASNSANTRVSEEFVNPEDDETDPEGDPVNDRESTQAHRSDSPERELDDDNQDDGADAVDPEGSPELGHSQVNHALIVSQESVDLGIDAGSDRPATPEREQDPYAVTSSPDQASRSRSRSAGQRVLFRYGMSKSGGSSRKRTRVPELPEMSFDQFKKRARRVASETQGSSAAPAKKRARTKKQAPESQEPLAGEESQSGREIAESPEAADQPNGDKLQKKVEAPLDSPSPRKKRSKRRSLEDDDEEEEVVSVAVAGRSVNQIARNRRAAAKQRPRPASRPRSVSIMSSDTGEEGLEDIPAVFNGIQ